MKAKLSATIILTILFISTFAPLGFSIKQFETTNTIMRDDFGTDDFVFTAYLYVDNISIPTEDTMQIIRLGNMVDKTIDVFLYQNTTATYIEAQYLLEGKDVYQTISWDAWHEIQCHYHYSDAFNFSVDSSLLWNGSPSEDVPVDRIEVGAWGTGLTGVDYSLFFDDLNWTAGTEDFEGAFPGGWTMNGNVDTSTVQSHSATHSLVVPVDAPLSVTLSDDTLLLSRNESYSIGAIGGGGLPPYSYKWYLNGTDQNVTTDDFPFRQETPAYWELWCNLTDSTNTSVISETCEITVEIGTIDVTIPSVIITLNFGQYYSITASVTGGLPPLQYQWCKNVTTAVGTNSSSYQLNATEWGVGVWELACNVTDDLGNTSTSNIDAVYISTGIISVTISPVGTTTGYVGLQTDFNSTVSGGLPPYTYEWYIDSFVQGINNNKTIYHLSVHNYTVILKVYDFLSNWQYSNASYLHVIYPTATVTPASCRPDGGAGANLTCTTPSGIGNYTFAWYQNGTLDYQSANTTNNINQYVFIPASPGIYQIKVTVHYYALWDSCVRDSNTVLVDATWQNLTRIPAKVAHLSTSGVELPLGHLAQKSDFSAHSYYWQFYYDGYLSAGYEFGYIRYKYSLDTQLWFQASNSPFRGARTLNNVPFTLPGASPAVNHGWANGLPFTIYYNNASDTLYLVYSNGTSTGNRSLKIVTASFNDTTLDWDWGTPVTIATYSNPRLPVCPSLSFASNGNPFVAFILSKGTSVSLGAKYARILAYYNGTNWNLNPAGVPSAWYSSEGAKKLVNVGDKIYITGEHFGLTSTIAIFDTTTEIVTEDWEITHQDMIPDDPKIWNLASFADDIRITVEGTVNGTFLGGDYVVLHLDVYNGSQWFNDIGVAWRIYMTGTGAPEVKNYSFSEILTSYLQTDEQIRDAQVRFWFTSPSFRVGTCILDYACFELDNSFGYTLETVSIGSYVDTSTNWTKVGSTPYLDYDHDGNYVTWTGTTGSNMVSYFTPAQPTYSVSTPNVIYIFSYLAKDVIFQYGSGTNSYLSAFLVAETGQSIITDSAGFTNMQWRHDYVETIDGVWWNYTLYYMNLASDINNIFDAKVSGVRAGFSSEYIFWNATLGGFQNNWLNQTDGLDSRTTLASSIALDGMPLEFHYYNESMYVTRYNGVDWNVLKFLDENNTILRMNYGEDRCFSYAIQSSSYDLKFFMPFIRVTVRAQTQDGAALSFVGVIMNGELLYTPYSNSYDIIGFYTVTLDPAYLYFTSGSITYAFIYYTVEASPLVRYDTAHFQRSVIGDMIITIVYAVGAAPLIPSEATPTPTPETQYCLPLIFYILMILIAILGVYLYSQRQTWATAIPLIPIILWLLIFEPKTPIDEMPLVFLRFFTVPPWHLYMAIILTIVAVALLLIKARKK